MKKIFKFASSQWSLWLSLLSLGILNISLLLQNFTSNTWLTGWDDLHPEFNLGLNLSRSLSAVWQEYQGLGLLGGMGHAADLPREIILTIASIVIPISQLRYFWVFLMLFFGSTGVFILTRFLLQKNNSKSYHLLNLSAFIAAVFYLLNLATVQTFYTPFETFVSFFGFLPWLVYFCLKYLKNGEKRNLLSVFFIFLIGATSFYVQTLFLVFVIVLAIFAVDVLKKLKRQGFKRLILLCATILAASAYWLLPPLYFTFSGESVIEQSKINSIATTETQLMNQGAATLSNITTLRGFWFDYIDIDSSGNYRYLYQDWRAYVENPVIQIIGISLFALAAVGFIYHFAKKDNFWRYSIPIGFIFCFVMLALGNSLLGNIPVIGQAFRSVFTKWSTVASLFYALGLGSFVALIAKRFKLIGLGIITTLLLIGAVVFVKPVFEGQMISPTVRVQIPERYFNLFNYFASQPEQSRIVNLPMQSFWGWYSYDWGYRGSGFLWYGIKQPILDRTFDVWSGLDESFYHEFSTALYAQDTETILDLIKKYDISYFLFDTSIVAPKGQEKLLMTDQTKQLLSDLGGKVAFDENGLMVYKFSNSNSFVESPDSYVSINSDTNYTRTDTAFSEYGSYIDSSNSVYFPFNNLTKEKIDNINFNNNIVNLTTQLPALSGYSVNIPAFDTTQTVDMPITISYKSNELAVTLSNPYDVVINGQKQDLGQLPTLYMTTNKAYSNVIVTIGKNNYTLFQGQVANSHLQFNPNQDLSIDVFDGTNPKSIDISTEFRTSDQVINCWTREGQTPVISTTNTNGVMSITTKDAVGCVSYKLGSLGPNKALLQVSLPYKSENNSRPDFCIQAEGVSDCLNDEVFYHSKASDTWVNVTRQTKLGGNVVYWMVLSGRPSDTAGEAWTINYQVPQITYYPQIAGYTFKPTTWQDFFGAHSINADSLSDFRATFSSEAQIIDFANNGRDAENCDLFKRGSVAKQVSGSNITYSAVDLASACDYLTLQNINTHDQFLLRIQGDTLVGRGPKIYLFNTSTNRNDIEDLVGQGKFDTSYSVLPWLNLDAKDYVLNLEVRSFNNSNTVNKISNISLYRLPITWLTSWQLSPQASAVSQNNLTISNTSHTGTYQFTAVVNAKADNGLVKLSQGYDTGWIAFSGLRVLKHVKVDGWANGWLVPSGEQKITMFYLPQILEALGLGMALVYIFWIGKNKFPRLH